jgi:hypothetical protein
MLTITTLTKIKEEAETNQGSVSSFSVLGLLAH